MRSRLSPAPVLVLRAVAKAFHAGIPGCFAACRVLRCVDLVVRSGERVAVVGEPGSGRTTLLLLAAGLLRPDRGEIWRAPGGSLWLRGAPVVGVPGTGEARRRPPSPCTADPSVPWAGALAWSPPVTVLAIADQASGAPRWATRVVLLERGMLAPVPEAPRSRRRPLPRGRSAPRRRVDSVPGAP